MRLKREGPEAQILFQRSVSRLPLAYIFCPSLLVVEAGILSFWRPSAWLILVVKNIILRQRAAVYVSDGGLHGHGVLKAKVPVLPSVGRGRAGLRRRPRGQVGLGAEAVGVAVDAVEVLGDAAAIHQELRQEVAL